MKSLFIRLMIVLLALVSPAAGADTPVAAELQYPGRQTAVVLLGVEGDELIFRAAGRDTGGRGYLPVEPLIRQRVALNVLPPPEFFRAVETLEQGRAAIALDALRATADPLVLYLGFGELPGNMASIASLYLNALVTAARWNEASGYIGRLELARVSPVLFDSVIRTGLAFIREGRTVELGRLQSQILGTETWGTSSLAGIMRLADAQREAGSFAEALALYRLVQSYPGPLENRARLWGAYCSLELGQRIIPVVFLNSLPAIGRGDEDFALQRLVVARLRESMGDWDGAMRSAAEGAVYADRNDPLYAELLYSVGGLHAARGEALAANSAWREQIVLYPSGRLADQTRQRLESMRALEITNPESDNL